METQSYYRLLQTNGCNIFDDSRHIIVNCAGICALTRPFCTFNPNGRNDYYLMYLTKGALTVSVGEQEEKELHAGQIFLFPPRTAYRYSSSGEQEIDYYWVHFTGYGAAGLLSECTLPIATVCSVGLSAPLFSLYHKLFDCFLLHSSCAEIAAAGYFTAICAALGDAIHSAADRPSGEPFAQQIYTSLSYLHENIAKPISVPMLASMEHLCVSRYRALFSSITGLSPIVYLTRLRISRACELLTQTNFTLSEIAAAVGYDDAHYFSRIFHAQIGKSPSAYRKR